MITMSGYVIYNIMYWTTNFSHFQYNNYISDDIFSRFIRAKPWPITDFQF